MRARLQFDFEWRITLLTLLLFPLLVSLGAWQLQRAAEKTALAAAFERKQQQPPADLGSVQGLAPAELAYLPVRLRGHFRPQQTFLLDNRSRGGQYGNEVLTVFETDSGLLALVNRGWVPADPARLQPTQVPPLPPAPGGLSITGQVYVAPGKPFLLADEPLEAGWPKRIQAVEMAKLAAGISEKLFPYPIHIRAGQPGALQADWQVINITPARHRAYAVQWFSMAAVLLLLFLLRSTNLWECIRGSREPAPRDE